ncbi:hypothetical protein [Rheinheimera sp. EpRS3]|uniref:hypothetical protein n=1 Tax=Rheinheimera sp. EpRS3 TaxID=1712383 RepID=UPI000749CEE5|nr:hypothetical protein [Rheinheimera sp. EpRS3]KUM54306.1 hypothetical protein AR688_13355 [Rheinheimera sp. EpRS3]
MARPKIPTINWRKELKILNRYIKSEGGVLHIKTTPDSPSSAFSKSIRNVMENNTWDRRWVTVQFDGDNAATHYLSDMISQLEVSLELDEFQTVLPAHEINIGNNNIAGGNIEISNINVSIVGANSFQERIKRIIQHIENKADEQRVALFLFNTGSNNTDQKELKRFKNQLWDNRLEKLVEKGVLLIAFSHSESDTLDWLPEPDDVLNLPSSYCSESKANAREDIARFLLEQAYATNEGEAEGIAKGIVASNPLPKNLHANFAGILAEVRNAD